MEGSFDPSKGGNPQLRTAVLDQFTRVFLSPWCLIVPCCLQWPKATTFE